MLHFKLLFSRAKWKKGYLLLRERWLIWSHPLRNLRVGRSPDSISKAAISAPLTTTCLEFDLDSSIPLPPEIYHKCNNYTQDTYNEETSSVETHFDYKIVDVQQGAFYSNGCTHVSVYDGSNQFIQDLSYQKYHNRKRLDLRIDVEPFLPGRTVSLYGNVENTVGNYGHWFIDGLSRLFLVLEKFSMEEIDYFLVPKLRYEFQRDSLKLLGIDDAKIIEIAPLQCFRFEHLICTTAPRGYHSTVCPEWMINGFRRNYLSNNNINASGRKLYISRRDAGSRKFVNEHEITTLVESYGFEVIELSSCPLSEKVALFSSAECIVGLTGAGMTNLMFCAPHTKVVELLPESYVNYLYTSVCGCLDLDYRYVLFGHNSSLSRANQYYGNLRLDVDVLEQELIAMGCSSNRKKINAQNFDQIVAETEKLMEKKA